MKNFIIDIIMNNPEVIAKVIINAVVWTLAFVKAKALAMRIYKNRKKEEKEVDKEIKDLLAKEELTVYEERRLKYLEAYKVCGYDLDDDFASEGV